MLDAYRGRGFRPRARVDGYDLAKPVFVITLDRRSKKRCAADAAKRAAAFTTNAGGACAISAAGIGKSILIFRCTA